MSRRKNPRYEHLKKWLKEYSDTRTLDFNVYSPYHMRIMDGGYVTLDAWVTGRYYVLQTDYNSINTDKGIIERQGEKGSLEVDNKEALFKWLDQLFFAADMESVQ